MAVVEVLLYVVLGYLLLGVFCLIPLHAAGLRRIDLGTAGSGWWFRLLITPGMIVFWPLLLSRWRRARRTFDPAPGAIHRPFTAEGIRRLHGRLALMLLILAPAVLIVAVTARPGRIEDSAPPELTGALPPRGEASAEHASPFDDLPVALALRTGEGAPQLELQMTRAVSTEPLLLYWTPDLDRFPEEAAFLGEVTGSGARRYDLDERVRLDRGTLVLYSRAQETPLGEFPMKEL